MPSSGILRIRSGSGKETVLSNNEQPNFFDARTIMAIILVAGTFMGWQWYMQKKYPDAFKKKAAVTETGKPVQQDKEVADKQNPGATNPPAPVPEVSQTVTAE